MQAEREVVRFLSAYQTIWHAHFPSLFRRAQWHIVTHLCTNGREGAAVGELYGLVKQVFLLDDSTVKERILEIQEQQLCVVDPPNAALSARSVVAPDDGAGRSVRSPSAGAGEGAVRNGRHARCRDAHRATTQARCRAAGDHSAITHTMPRAVAAGARSHLQRQQSVACPSGRGDPASQLAVALDAAAHGGRASLWRFQVRRQRAGHPRRPDGGKPAQPDGAEFPDDARSHRVSDGLGLLERQPGKSLRVALSESAAAEFHRAFGTAAGALPEVARSLAATSPAHANGGRSRGRSDAEPALS